VPSPTSPGWAAQLASCTPAIADQDPATLFPHLPGFQALAENSLAMAASYGPSHADYYFVVSPHTTPTS
jgi:hypothetical protein